MDLESKMALGSVGLFFGGVLVGGGIMAEEAFVTYLTKVASLLGGGIVITSTYLIRNTIFPRSIEARKKVCESVQKWDASKRT